MPPGPLDQNIQPYYQPDGRIPQTQLPPGAMRQVSSTESREHDEQRENAYNAESNISFSSSSSTAFQNFGPMSPFMNSTNPPIYGQTPPPYMPQNMYMGPNPYAPSIHTPQVRPQYPPIKRERKVFKIVNPETHEVVTSSKSTTTPASTPPQVPVAAPVATQSPVLPPVAALPPSLAPYQKGPSKALKIEAPSAAPLPYTKPPSKALKIEPPPPEKQKLATAPTIQTKDTISTAVPDATTLRPSQVKENVYASANGTRETEQPQIINAAPEHKSTTKESVMNTEKQGPPTHDSVPIDAGKEPSSPNAIRVDETSTIVAEEDSQVDSVSVSLEKLNLSEQPQTSSSKGSNVNTAAVNTTPVQTKARMDVETLTTPLTGAMPTLDTTSSTSGTLANTSSMPSTLPAAQNVSTTSISDKSIEPIVEAVTPEVSKNLSDDSSKTPSNGVATDENKSDELSWRKAPTTPKDTPADKSWREKTPGLNLSGTEGMGSAGIAGSGEDGRTPKKSQRPDPVIHTPGARRVYGLQWLNEMKIFCMDTKAPAEAQRCGIAKGFAPSKPTTPSSRGSHGGGRGGSVGGAQWTRGQQMPIVFSGAGGKGPTQYVQSDRVPRRGVKLPPVPSPQAQSWRGANRTNDFPGINRAPPLPPVEPLKKSENAWGRKKEDDDDVASKRKTVRSILNKLTPEKFEKLYKQFIAVEITTVDVLDGVVREIFEKAVLEPKFADLYAELCQRLSKETAQMLAAAKLVGKNGKPITFKRVLVTNVVQKEFQSFANAEKLKKEADESSKAAAMKEQTEEEKKVQTDRNDELERDAVKAKRRMLGNINFIGELYKKSLIPENRIHQDCVQKLLNLGIETREDEVLEALCKLLASVGQKLSENVKAKMFIDRYFEELDKLSRDHSLPSRIRFMMQNLIEMRQNNWKRRREEVKAKKISEVHADIQREERAKQEASARSRGRGGGGRYQSRYDRPHRMPAPAMTMAPERRNSPSVPRAVKQRERFNVPMGAQARSQIGSGDARLAMPSSRRTLGKVGSGSSMALKPGGSTRFSSLNSYSALGDVDESNAQTLRNGLPENRAGVERMRSRSVPAEKAVPAPRKPESTGLDPQKVKDKARSYQMEYLSIKDLKEAQECVQTEVPKVNHVAFIDAALRYALDLKPEDGEQLMPLYVAWTSIIPAACYQEAFTDIVGSFDDVEMDSPNAGVFMSQCLGRLSALGKLATTPNDGVMGLGFMSKAVDNIMDGKRAIKLVIRTFAELGKSLESQMKDQIDRERRLQSVFASLDLDLKALAVKWNPVRGAAVLKELLSEYNVQFLEPLLGVDEKVKGMLAEGKTGRDVAEFVKTAVPTSALKSAQLVRLLVREGLDYACQSTRSATKDSLTRAQVEEETKRFKSNVVPMLIETFGNAETENFADERFVMVLETQRFCCEHNFPPGLPDAENGEQKLIARLFYDLYDSEVVDEDVLKRWKDDLGESDKVGGKEQALVQSQRFFSWLETAEPEE